MELTLLKDEEIWGDQSLEVLQLTGTKVPATDFALAMGGRTRSDIRTMAGEATCAAWTVSMAARNHVRAVGVTGISYYFPARFRNLGIRPVLSSQITRELSPQKIENILLPNHQTVTVASYGQYPQTVVNADLMARLEKDYRKRQLSVTNRSYTYDARALNRFEIRARWLKLPEYCMGNETYVRFISKCEELSVLSNGKIIHEGFLSWFRVEPVKWLVDATGCWVSQKALMGGVQFDFHEDYTGNFKKTDLYKFMNNYMQSELFPQKVSSQSIKVSEPEKQLVNT